MSNKAPRYILREYAVMDLLKDRTSGEFLEIGYGAGDMLVSLSRAGLSGCGFDFSDEALGAAHRKLAANKISEIELRSEMPSDEKFRYIFFFEVIGYIADPIGFFKDIGMLLEHDGEIIFSFTNKKHHGVAEKKTGDMKCFARREIAKMLNEAGYRKVVIVNYGYPLSNVLRPLLHCYHYFKTEGETKESVKASGLDHDRRIFRIAALFVNEVTLYPFLKCQQLFKNSDLGTGYIVQASKGN